MRLLYKMKYFLVFLMVLFTAIVMPETEAGAEVLKLTGFSLQDEFIKFWERLSYDGTVSTFVVNDTPRFQASLQSRMPLEYVVNMFDDYLEDNGVESRMKRCPYCAPPLSRYTWNGNIDDNKCDIVIDSVSGSRDIVIRAYSDIEQPYLKRQVGSVIDKYPEFMNLSGKPVTKYETIGVGGTSAVLFYNTIDSSQKEAESAVRKLTSAGWRLLQDRIFNARKTEYVAILVKDGCRAAVTAADETLVVSVTPHSGEL